MGPPWVRGCDSGVTACVIALASKIAFGEEAAPLGILDGAWTKYATEVLRPQVGHRATHTILLCVVVLFVMVLW